MLAVGRGGALPLTRRGRVLVLVIATAAAIIASFTGPVGAILVVLAVVGVGLAVYAPGVTLAAFLLIPFYKAAAQPYSPIDITVLLAGLNALQVIPVVLDRTHRRVSRAGLAVWFSMALLVLAGVLYAPDQQLAGVHAASYWALLVIPITPAAVRVGSDSRYVRQLIWSAFGLAVLTVLVGLQVATGTQRLQLLGTNTINTAIASLLVPVIGATFVLREGPRPLRVATYALIPAAILVALATGSRGPVVAMLILGLVGIATHLTRARAVNWRLMGAIVGLIVISFVVLSVAVAALPAQSTARFSALGDLVQDTFAGGLDSGSADVSTGGRIALFQLAVTLFQENPILGVGTAGYEALSPGILGPDAGAAYPHNALLQIATEQGLIGVALFVGIVAIALTRRLDPGGAALAIRAMFLFLLLEAMVSGDIFSDRTTWGLMMLLLMIEVPAVKAGSVPGDARGSPEPSAS